MRTKEEDRLDESIRKLRAGRLEKGHPFMVRDLEFAPEGFIYEYPDGTMKYMMLSADKSIIEVRSFNSTEINQIRKRHNLPLFQYA